MRTGFDLSPVIDLLDALTPKVAHPFVPDPAALAAAAGARKTLGDFSELLQFLADYRTRDPLPLPPDPAPPPGPVPPPDRKRARRPRNATVSFADTAPADWHTDTTEELPRAPAPRLLPACIQPPPAHGVAAVVLRVSAPAPAPAPAAPPPRQPTASERKARLIQLVAALFPADAPALLRRGLAPAPAAIHVFIDNSNILISFYEHIKALRSIPNGARTRAPPLSFHNLTIILERGRTALKRALVGSHPRTPVIDEAAALGYETSILERVHKERPTYSSSSSGSESPGSRRTRMAKVEQAVDEILHLKILESILDFPPSTIVLASGDGAAGEFSPGFFRVVERALERGWKIELAAFKKSLSFLYEAKQFKQRWKGQFQVIQLDQFAELLLDEAV